MTRILTPGTLTDPEMLDEGKNNYLVALEQRGRQLFRTGGGGCFHGDFRITELQGEGAWGKTADELRRTCSPARMRLQQPRTGRCLAAFFGAAQPGGGEPGRPLEDSGSIKAILTAQWGEKIWDQLKLDRYPLAAAAGGSTAVLLNLQYRRKACISITWSFIFPQRTWLLTASPAATSS